MRRQNPVAYVAQIFEMLKWEFIMTHTHTFLTITGKTIIDVSEVVNRFLTGHTATLDWPDTRGIYWSGICVDYSASVHAI